MKALFISLLAIISFRGQAAIDIYFLPGAHFNGNIYYDLAAYFPGSNVMSMPNHARFPTPEFNKSRTLKVYAESVCRFMKGPSIVVGHSQGGAVLNQMLGLCPDKVKGIIYIAAAIPFPGEKPFDLLGSADDEYYLKAVVANEERGLFMIEDMAAFIEGFAHDASTGLKQRVGYIAINEPIAPSNSVLTFDLAKLQSIPKLAIKTAHDRIITPETQQKYLIRLKNVEIVEVASGHLPMITRPKELAAIISKFISKLL